MILDTEKAHGLVRGLGLCLQSEQIPFGICFFIYFLRAQGVRTRKGASVVKQWIIKVF